MARFQKPLIITFMGPVGVGKSTQIQLLKKYLRSRNINVSVTFLKSSHAMSYVIQRMLVVLGVRETAQYFKGSSRIYPRKEVMKRLFALWCLLDSFSISLKFFFTVYLPHKLGFTVLIEEGLIMTFYTYAESFPRFLSVKPKTLKLPAYLLAWVEKQNHVNIVLDASNKELDLRRAKRNFRQEELHEYVIMQKRWMQSLDLHDTIFIETTGKSLSAVRKSIIATVDQRMK